MTPFREARVCDCGGHGFVGLTSGKAALFDPEDVSLVSGVRWSSLQSGGRKFYARSWISGARVMMHRLIGQPKDSECIDHINGDTLDNRRSNLRACSHAENMRNKRPQSGAESSYRGVHRGRRGGWDFQVYAQGVRIRGTGFETEIEAAQAYDAAAAFLHGEFS